MEGYFDVISAQANGVENAVASCGTAMTAEHVKLLSIYTKSRRIFLSFDTDNAYVFADIYKLCAENNGKFVIVNAPSCVREALSFAYLEDVIPQADSVEDGVKLLSCEEATR